jgi:hypothetical protein
LDEPLPGRLVLPDSQTSDWKSRWTKATRGAPITFDKAMELAVALADPVLSGTARDKSWGPSHSRWSAAE